MGAKTELEEGLAEMEKELVEKSLSEQAVSGTLTRPTRPTLVVSGNTR